MIASQRRKEILKILKKNKSLDATSLSKELFVSIPTIYKDLGILEKKYYIKREYGFIELAEDVQINSSGFKEFLKENVELKKIIAKEAIKLVESNDTLFIDSSSTCYFFCLELRKTNLTNITIITNSIFIPNLFFNKDNFNIVIVGGTLLKKQGALIDGMAEKFLKNIFGNKFFFSTAAFSDRLGVIDSYNPSDIKIKEIFSKNSDKYICLLDSTKFRKSGQVNWINLDRLTILITDKYIDTVVLKNLNNKKMEVIIAE